MGKIYGASSTKKLTATGQVTTAGKAGILRGYSLKIGSTITSVLFADGSGGTEKWGDGYAAQTVAGDVWIRHTFKEDIPFSNDIYATLAGTGAVLYVEYVETED
jgi:hypothetical protein